MFYFITILILGLIWARNKSTLGLFAFRRLCIRSLVFNAYCKRFFAFVNDPQLRLNAMALVQFIINSEYVLNTYYYLSLLHMSNACYKINLIQLRAKYILFYNILF